jgi:RNA-binding protein
VLSKRLGGKALRYLRGLGHALAPVVAVGKNGVTGALVRQTEQALSAHELIKVKVMQEAPVDRREAAEDLARKTGAVLAQVLGRTFLLYRARPKKPTIVLPRSAKASEAGTRTEAMRAGAEERGAEEAEAEEAEAGEADEADGEGQGLAEDDG